VLGPVHYAKDAQGRAQDGAPFVDTHIYAAHNGALIEGLVDAAVVLNDDALLLRAVHATEHLLRTHVHDGVVAHEAGGRAHLADQVAMARALLELDEATGDVRWRKALRDVVTGLRATFEDRERGGFVETPVDAQARGVFAQARVPLRENAEAARVLMALGRLDDDDAHVQAAHRALLRVGAPAVVAAEGRFVGELLLALDEALHEPLHIAIVSDIDDDATRALHKAALTVDAPVRLVERVAPGGKYPHGEPAAYVCGPGFCSPPITDAALLPKKAAALLRTTSPAPTAQTTTP
jgi:hypothetical protein